jgi:hypothetical protein
MPSATRPRPNWLRALGRDDPPAQVEVGGNQYHLIEIYKHDSWAATARYENSTRSIVCKFNRRQSIFGVPMAWLGRRLAHRESRALRKLAGLPGIPVGLGSVSVDGLVQPNAVAREYVAGRPLHSKDRPNDCFFAKLRQLIDAIHARNIAYVDLHKRENVLVGDDGEPWLIDFQVHYALRGDKLRHRLFTPVLRALQKSDRYHWAKHVQTNRPDQFLLLPGARRPWWIRAHRVMAVPLRKLRRKLLVLAGVRSGAGKATSELFPEDAVRRELAA